MGRATKRAVFEACSVGETRGAGRVHLRRPSSDRALCGRVVQGTQPPKATAVSCFACVRRHRETLRPPSPPPELAPVMADRSSRVHLASRTSLWPHETTLCGREVAGVLAIGAVGVSCKLCVVRAKGAA